mmetsp:Transcript_28981/g.48708  ORF Transcript_28981/g.48708 Transcript_28981/m.48708 type:complete len:485 (+) Transcript_28981:195-1649(+)
MIVHILLTMAILCLGTTSAFRLNVPNVRTYTYRSSVIMQDSWQQELDQLLDIDTSFESRRSLTRSFLGKLGTVTSDVVDAVRERNLNKIAPRNLAYGRAVYGYRDFRKQLRRDVIPDLLTKGVPKLVEEGPKIISSGPSKLVSTSRKILSATTEIAKNRDKREAAIKDVKREVRNIVKRTPEGLDTPSYDVLAVKEQFEIRKYDPYAIVSTKVTPEEGQDTTLTMEPLPMSNSFCALSDYLNGENSPAVSADADEAEIVEPVVTSAADDDFDSEPSVSVDDFFDTESNNDDKSETMGESLSMTTPVIMDDGSMSFVLPGGLTADIAPKPTADGVTLQDIKEEIVAVREFTGLITEGEVARQRAKLEDSLIEEGIVYENPTFKVLAYNSPLTVPWVRRNEVMFTIQLPDGIPLIPAAAEAVADTTTTTTTTAAASTVEEETAATAVETSASADKDEVDGSASEGDSDSSPPAEQFEYESSPEAGD